MMIFFWYVFLSAADPTQWWYEADGERAGPIAESALAGLVKQGPITKTTLVWTDGMANWTPAGDVEALHDIFAAPPPLPPTSTDAASPPSHERKAKAARGDWAEEDEETAARKVQLTKLENAQQVAEERASSGRTVVLATGISGAVVTAAGCAGCALYTGGGPGFTNYVYYVQGMQSAGGPIYCAGAYGTLLACVAGPATAAIGGGIGAFNWLSAAGDVDEIEEKRERIEERMRY